MATSMATRGSPGRSARPTYLTSFIGRASDLELLDKAVASNRLVTLIGPGGAGKTRIAGELAVRSADRWVDGVCWVDLASLDDPGQVAETIALAMGLEGSGDATVRVAAWLTPRTMLVILDNCEHLIDACAHFCESAFGPNETWTVLATSRQPLGVPGELRFPLSPLSSAEAASLFEQRAKLVKSSFAVAATNRDVVIEICRRLDDLPLAIELVAARANLMSEGELLSSIAEPIWSLFMTRSRDPRHATLLATIDWSYRLLDDPEATLFRRLAVFRGGFAIDAVRAVCADGLRGDVVEILAGLVDKSMVMVVQVADGVTRYRLLESQLAYAETKLNQSGEALDIGRRHYEYFNQELFARSNAVVTTPLPLPKPITPADNRWKRRETENMWAALRWARDNTEDLGMPMAVAFLQATTGNVQRKRVWMDDLIARAPDLGAVTSWAMGAAAGAAWLARDFDASVSYCERRLERLAKENDPIQVGFTLSMIGNAKQEQGDLGGARAIHESALEVALEFNSPELTSMVKNNLGCLELERGNFRQALKLLSEAVEIDARVSGPMGRANSTESLANAQLGCGDTAAAERSWCQSIELVVESENEEEAIVPIGGLARAAATRADYRRAVRLAAAHDRLAHEYSYREQRFWAAELERCKELCRTKLGRAYDEAWVEGQTMGIHEAIAYALGEAPPGESIEPLSKREAEVLRLVASGLSNRDVAAKLFLSERTVEGHLDRIRDKLGIRSRAQLGLWAVAHGLALR